MQAHTSQRRFVGDILTKFAKSPLAVSAALRLPNRWLGAFPDTRQVFEGQVLPSVFGFGNEAFADNVIGVGLEPPFAPTEALQLALGALGSDLLKRPPQAVIVLARSLYRRATERLTIAISGEIDDAQVNPQHALNFVGCRFLDFAHGEQVPFVAYQHKVTLALTCLKHLALTFTCHERYTEPTVNSPDGDFQLGQLPRQDTVIVGDASRQPKHALGLAVQLVGISHFCQDTHSYLSRQAELLPNCTVAQVVQVVLPERLRLPRLPTDVVGSSVRRLKGSLEGVRLFGRRLQFDLSNQLHGDTYKSSRLEEIIGVCREKSNPLAFLDVAFNRLCAHMACRTDIVAFRPQRRVLAPVVALEGRELLHQQARATALEASDNLGRRPLGRTRDEQVYMVGHHLKSQDAELKFRRYLGTNLFQPFSNLARENYLPIARNPHEVVVDLVDNVRTATNFRHGTTLLKREVWRFLHPLKGVVSAPDIV